MDHAILGVFAVVVFIASLPFLAIKDYGIIVFLLGLSLIAADVTQKVAAERALQVIESRLSTILEHTAAGGYLFGSVGGSAASQYWDNFPFAELYGANHGSYIDDAPMVSPAISHLGSAATHGENTLAVVGLQPLLPVSIGGAGGGLYSLANANRVMRFGTNGDAKTLLDVLYAAGLWNGGVIGHTGAPRMQQRGTFQWQ